MIIQIRGTSGSGKSTVVTEIMKSYKDSRPIMTEGRKKPLKYRLKHPDYKQADLEVLGHYESACGGCDTLPPAGYLFDMVRRSYDAGYNVLFEGLLASEDTKWTYTIKELQPLIIFLDTPLAVCFEGIKARRLAKRITEEVDPKNTTNRVRTIDRAFDKLAKAGFMVEKHSRDSAVKRIKEFLHV